MSNTYSKDRERALSLARTGNYEDWHAVCRKMLFDGWGIEIFNEAAFTAEIDTRCARARSEDETDRTAAAHEGGH